MALRNELVSLSADTGGLEIYFVDRISPSAIANHDAFGIVLSTNATFNTLAHEIGHAFGCADVYPAQKFNPQVHIPDSNVNEAHLPLDWNNGTGYRYYTRAISQEDIIRRLQMCGKAYSGRYDLSSGAVYGFTADGSVGLVDVGFFRSGYRRTPKYHR